MKTNLLVIAMSVAAAAPSIADEKHRELGPHVHGQGTFNIAIENTRVSIELEAPGMDIVGFEHEANSGEQKAAFAKAEKQLADPLSLFKFPESAECKLSDAKIVVDAEDEHDHADDHDHDHGDKKADDHDEHGGHNAFHVTYAIDCAKPANLTSVAFDYFKTFAGAKKLEVSVVTDKAQSKFEVTSEKPVLDLAGAI
jgi:hypothetical protein